MGPSKEASNMLRGSLLSSSRKLGDNIISCNVEGQKLHLMN